MEIKVKHQGKEHRAEAQIIAGKVWVHFQGRTFTADAGGSRKARKGAGSVASADKIVSPMPGKITKVLVQTGQAVQPGTAILVMEAMKMEYTLKADVAGSVEAIQCQVGDQVVLGKVLVQLKVD